MSWQSVGFRQTSSLGRRTIWQPLMGWTGEANLGDQGWADLVPPDPCCITENDGSIALFSHNSLFDPWQLLHADRLVRRRGSRLHNCMRV